MYNSLKINCDLRTFFLYSLFLFTLFMPFSNAPKNIFMGLVILLGFIYIYSNDNLKIKFDLINCSLVLLIIFMFISSLLVEDTLSRVFKVNRDFLRMVLVFFILRNIDFSFTEVKRYLIFPLILSFLIVFSIGFYENYIVISSDRFRMMGPVNKSVVYMLFMLTLTFPLIFQNYFLNKWKNIFIISSIISSLGILIATSRSGWLALACLSLLYIIINIKYKKVIYYMLFISTLFIMITGYAFGPMLVDIIVPYRFDIWLSGWEYYLKNNIFFGIGTNNFNQVDLSKYMPNWHTNIAQTHNDFLKILFENGLFSFISFLVFMFSIILYIKHKLLNSLFYLNIVSLLIVFFISSLFQNILVREFGMLFFILLAIYLNKYLIKKVNNV